MAYYESTGPKKLKTPEPGNSPTITADLKKLAEEIDVPVGTNSGELKSESVETAAIKNENVTEPKLGTESVSAPKIKASAVTAAKIGPEAVDTAAVKNLAVTSAKLGNEAVTEGKLANGAVGLTKMSTAAQNKFVTNPANASGPKIQGGSFSVELVQPGGQYTGEAYGYAYHSLGAVPTAITITADYALNYGVLFMFHVWEATNYYFGWQVYSTQMPSERVDISAYWIALV